MGVAKRIIPCLDVDAGRVVKGVKFLDIRDAGDPVNVARGYNQAGADEITFLDITASSDNRDTMVHVVEQVASEVFIPLTVGGGIRQVSDVRRLLIAGADKVGINTPARWEIFTHGGRKPTGIDAVQWAIKMADFGAGEILLTSMDRDGTKIGFDLALTRAISDAVQIPVIASGGVGKQHMAERGIEVRM